MSTPATEPRAGASLAFGYITTLFFAWGFATALLDPLIAAVKRVFELNNAEAFLTTSAWYIAYGLMSLPAAWVLGRLGYGRSIISALIVMVGGCLIVPAATAAEWYPGVLIALFVIASGATLLQVAANPLVAQLGSPKGAHTRLNLSQAFNALGTTLGPWLGSHVLLTGGVFAAGAVITAATRSESLRSIDMAFAGMAAVFAFVAIFIFTARKKINAAAPAATETSSPLKALSSPWAIFGALSLFLYVGSEVAIGGMLTNFLASPDVLNAPIETAGKMVALYWGGAMVGRFLGSAMLTKIRPGLILLICTMAAACLCLFVSQVGGPKAAYAALSIGLFNSIMFPTIFTLTLERSTAPASATSGLLVFGIIGGALLPQIAARVADVTGELAPAFFVPMLGYLAVMIFAAACLRSPPRVDVDDAPRFVGH